MHFKFRGSRVQVYAYVGYDAGKRRPLQRMLGSMDRYRPKIGDDLAAELTAEQRQEVEDWIKAQAKEIEASINRGTITSLPENLGRAASAISPEISLELVNDIYVAMADLAKSLRKAGFKRPQKPSKGPSKANPQEPTLL